MSENKDEPAAEPQSHGSVDRKVLELLVCPVTKTALEYDAQAQELISRAAGLAFPIVDGMPVMLVDHARRLDDTPAGGG